VIAVDDVNLEIADREFVVLVGPSGCGKTTTLRMIAGLEEISDGEISIGDRVVNKLTPMERNIAMVFQSYALYPHMNVFDNMAFGLKMRKVPKEQREAQVKKRRTSWVSRICWIANPNSCPVVNDSASRWAVPL